MKVISKLELDDDFDDKLRKHIRAAAEEEHTARASKPAREDFASADYAQKEQTVISLARRLVKQAYKLGAQYGDMLGTADDE